MSARTSNYLSKVISGGQTGVDRAALDAAIAAGVPYDGWVPKGRRAEDGRVPERYVLRECATGDYPARTAANVEMCDLAIVVGDGPGSLLTVRLARGTGRAVAHLYAPGEKPATELVHPWRRIIECEIRGLAEERRRPVSVLIAGSRESREPGIYAATLPLLTEAFARLRGQP